MRWNYYKLRQLSLLLSAMDGYYKLRQLFYYKVRHGLLQIATGITKCDGFITNCNRCCKVGWLLQIATVQYFIRISDTESKPLKWLSLKRSRVVLVHRFRGNWSSKKFHRKFLTEYWLLLVTAKGPIQLKIHVHSFLQILISCFSRNCWVWVPTRFCREIYN